jgi:hypothetical protein
LAREKTAVIIPQIQGTGKCQNGVPGYQPAWILFADNGNAAIYYQSVRANPWGLVLSRKPGRPIYGGEYAKTGQLAEATF